MSFWFCFLIPKSLIYQELILLSEVGMQFNCCFFSQIASSGPIIVSGIICVPLTYLKCQLYPPQFRKHSPLSSRGGSSGSSHRLSIQGLPFLLLGTWSTWHWLHGSELWIWGYINLSLLLCFCAFQTLNSAYCYWLEINKISE